MRTWKLPDPPDESVTVLRDGEGVEYRRSTADGEYWFCEGPVRKRGTYHWTNLLYQRGPVTADDEYIGRAFLAS